MSLVNLKDELNTGVLCCSKFRSFSVYFLLYINGLQRENVTTFLALVPSHEQIVIPYYSLQFVMTELELNSNRKRLSLNLTKLTDDT